MQIPNKYKAELGLLLAKGHAKFGPVAARRPYRNDDDDGEGAASLSIEEHPLLAQLPIGAASDLTAIASENSEVMDEALARVDELNPELQNQPALKAELGLRYSNRNTPKPSPL
jgi:hypothetical protein